VAEATAAEMDVVATVVQHGSTLKGVVQMDSHELESQ
jgi:hypothetical protein